MANQNSVKPPFLGIPTILFGVVQSSITWRSDKEPRNHGRVGPKLLPVS